MMVMIISVYNGNIIRISTLSLQLVRCRWWHWHFRRHEMKYRTICSSDDDYFAFRCLATPRLSSMGICLPASSRYVLADFHRAKLYFQVIIWASTISGAVTGFRCRVSKHLNTRARDAEDDYCFDAHACVSTMGRLFKFCRLAWRLFKISLKLKNDFRHCLWWP